MSSAVFDPTAQPEECSSSITSMLDAVSLHHGETCPNCRAGAMRYSGQIESIGKNFAAWERNTGSSIPDNVRAQYDLDRSLHHFLCDQCGYQFFAPTVAGSAEYYQTVATTSYYEDCKEEFDEALKTLASLPVSSLLEIGPGEGRFLDRLRQTLPHIERFTYDKNPRTHETLSRLATVIEEPAMAGRRFDAVCAFQLIEHVENPFSFVSQASDRLVPGGILLLSAPDFKGLYRFYYDSWTETPPHHLTRWTAKSLRTLLCNHGFEKVCIKRLPLSARQFPTYVPLLWYLILRHLRLENNVWLTEQSKHALGLLKKLGIRHLPFVPMILLAVGRKA